MRGWHTGGRSGGADVQSSDTPEGAVRAYYQALQEKRCADAFALVTAMVSVVLHSSTGERKERTEYVIRECGAWRITGTP
jgi:hypothetical protein